MLSFSILGQDRTSLEEERIKIIQQIELTQKNLESTQNTRSESLKELNLLNEKIKQRQALLSNLKNAVQESQQAIKSNEETLVKLSEDLEETKTQYSELLRYAYLKKKGSSKWTYILSADNLNKALLRWRYMKQYEAYCIQKSEEIISVKNEIDAKNTLIQEESEKQTALLQSNQKQQAILKSEKKNKDRLLTSLKKDEASLKKQLDLQKSQREDLNLAIEKFIVAELKASSELEEKKEEPTVIESETIAERKVTFAEAKGRLTWPVENGVTSSSFGVQAHPTLSGVKINNNGIDISVGPGSTVKSVFGGKVIGVTKIPGYDYMVIIQHGEYYTVYSKLSSVTVIKDEAVTEGQAIGSLGPEGTEIHFEVWQGKSKLNPQQWLQK